MLRDLGTGGGQFSLWASKTNTSASHPQSRAVAFLSSVPPAHGCPLSLQELLCEEQGYLGWKQYRSSKEHSRARCLATTAIQVAAYPNPSKAALAESTSTLSPVALLSGPKFGW